MVVSRNAGREVVLERLEGTRVLGFDCSSKTVGWGLVCLDNDSIFHLGAHGHIRPLPSKHDLMMRLSDLYDRVADLCARLDPQVITVEDIALFMKGGGSTAKTITTLAVFNRIVALAGFRHAGAVEFYPVQSVRKLVRQAASRKKVIGKEEMPFMIRSHLEPRFSYVEKRGGGTAEQTFDEADGIAVAWAHAHALKTKEK